jgi:hypothetical protein
LTWSRKQELDPRWPMTTIFAPGDAWIAHWMRPDHEELTRERERS